MIAWFARNGIAANLLMLAVMVAGIWTLWMDKIPIEVFQDVPSRFISINVPYPASSPEETEETIVVKIEEAIQQVGGINCKPITGEITYGLERLAMYLQGVDNVFDLEYSPGVSYGDVFHQNEVEQSTYNFEHSDVEFLLTAFNAYEKQAKNLMQNQLALPAYEQVLKAGHSFNLLDARGAISVTERAAYIGRIRNLARSVAQSYLDSRARLGFPMAPKAWAEEVLAQIEKKAA